MEKLKSETKAHGLQGKRWQTWSLFSLVKRMLWGDPTATTTIWKRDTEVMELVLVFLFGFLLGFGGLFFFSAR